MLLCEKKKLLISAHKNCNDHQSWSEPKVDGIERTLQLTPEVDLSG